MRSTILIVFILLSFIGVQAQNTPDYSDTDKKMGLISPNKANTVDYIAAYIKMNFKTDEQKTRAAYYWLSQNIVYDVENMTVVNFYENEQQVIDEAMKNRKGVCMHFATLFSWICNRAGVECFVVSGFTRQNGKIDVLPHAWNAALVNSKWELFDPTWGAGYILNGKYVKRLSNVFFNTAPEEFVKSHNPFDPIWQLLNYPLTNADFVQNKIAINTKKPLINFKDSIDVFKKLSIVEQLQTSNRRMKENGLENSILQKRYADIVSQIGRNLKGEMIDIYNQAVLKCNEAGNDLNEFINYRNKQFTPTKPDPAIKLMVEQIENSFLACRVLLNKMTYSDPSIDSLKQQLIKSIEIATENLNEQKKFLDKYFSTSKLFRKSLFYKYSIMGIPVN